MGNPCLKKNCKVHVQSGFYEELVQRFIPGEVIGLKPIKRMNSECDRDPFFHQNSVSSPTEMSPLIPIVHH